MFFSRYVLPSDHDHCPGCGSHYSGAILPNVVTKLTDVRYRSFHNFHSQQPPPPPPNFLAGKSRASWAVPLPVASQGRPVGHVLSTGFLAYPSEVDLSGGHHDFAG